MLLSVYTSDDIVATYRLATLWRKEFYPTLIEKQCVYFGALPPNLCGGGSTMSGGIARGRLMEVRI